MTVMARCYAVCSTGILDLLVFQFPVRTPCFRQTRLEKTSSASAAVIVRTVGSHVNKILFPDHRFYNKPQILGNRIAKTLSYKLAGVLNRKLYLQVLIPV